MYEVEIKARVDDLPELIERLRRLQAVETDEVLQSDEYFNHPCRDFEQTDEALRIRQVDNQVMVTYKGPKLDKVTKTRQEIEFPLGDRAEDQCRACLLALGFQPVATVRKRRRRWQLRFHELPFEIACDDVDELGVFCEVETTATSQNLDHARQAAAQLARELALQATITDSYLELLLDKRSQPGT